MLTARAFTLALAATSVRAYDQTAFAQRQAQSATPLVTIISEEPRLRASNAGLRIAVRDADAPDRPVDQAYIVLSAADSAADHRRPLSLSADGRGLVTAANLDSGEVSVWVRRVGYHEARLTIRLRANCEQILEVYIAQSIVQLDRCQIRTATSPPCDPDPRPTSSRAVLTTCGHAA